MKKLATFVTTAAILCLPASALAANSKGVVLSVNTHSHVLQVVDRRHVVHAYRFGGRLPHVRFGSQVRFRATGASISHVSVARQRAKHVSFQGQVVRMHSQRLLLQLADNHTVHVSATQAGSAADGLPAVGEVVLVTEGYGRGTPGQGGGTGSTGSGGTGGSGSGGGGGSGHGGGKGTGTSGPSSPGGAHNLDGTIVELSANTLQVQGANGSSTNFTAAPSVLAQLQASICETVTVAYHGSASTPVADTITENDDNPIAACNAAGNGPSGNPSGQQVVGSVTQITLNQLTIASSAGTQSVAATVALSGSFVIGDQVQVTYNQASNGSLVAGDVEYNELDAIGKVAAVSSGSITIENSSTNTSQTFTADPSDGDFDGVNPGDQADVTYHLSNGQATVDGVSDTTNPNS